jgi:hypothetical protein
MAARVKVDAGVCGMQTEILATAEQDYGLVKVAVASDCPHIQKLVADMGEVNSIKEISFRGDGPQTLRSASRTLPHPACIVPPSIVKAVEVAAGLALPRDASVHIAKE